MVKHAVTYTVKGFLAPFKDVVETEHGSDEEIRAALNAQCKEVFASERAVVRDLVLIVHLPQ